MLWIVVFLFLVLCFDPASAKDINLSLNEREQVVLRNLLDIAVKAGGLDTAPAAIHFVNKMQTLQQEQPVTPETPKPKE